VASQEAGGSVGGETPADPPLVGQGEEGLAVDGSHGIDGLNIIILVFGHKGGALFDDGHCDGLVWVFILLYHVRYLSHLAL